jgi:hypothetical protein
MASGVPRKRHIPWTINDSGQFSIDFYIGLSIFMVTLIIAVTMVSGLLIGLQSKKIDFDAVAYRTGVILVEDPGEPNNQLNNLTITEADQWEFIGTSQKMLVKRFGMSEYKSTPEILTKPKIQTFFNRSIYPDLSEYRERIIFGNYPYRFNITLHMMDGSENPPPIGEPYDPDSAFGYIRRVVLVKEPSVLEADLGKGYQPNSSDLGNGSVTVIMNYGWLMQNLTGSPSYWIEPPKEDININMVNISGVKNQSSTRQPSLTAIRVDFYGRLLQGTDVNGELPLEVPATINGTYNYTFPWPDRVNVVANNTVNIPFPAGFFIPPSSYSNITLIEVSVRYDFDPETVNLTPGWAYYYLQGGQPGLSAFTAPSLKPAVMEVRVW